MLRQAVNELSIKVEIQSKSPLLVKDGRLDEKTKKAWVGGKKGTPSAIPISRSPIDVLKKILVADDPAAAARSLAFYLPGSSVRGAWRSHLEKVLRSLDEGPKVCDPLIQEGGSVSGAYEACSSVLINKEDERVEIPYHESCPVCRVFGNTAQGSRLFFSDGEMNRGDPVLIDNVAISRQTGAVRSPFKAVALKNATFTLSLRLRNFELWQVGMLGHLFDDLENGLVPIGSGKNKGWGQNKARTVSVDVMYFGNDYGCGGKLRGIGEIIPPEKCREYGILPASPPPAVESELLEPQGALWRHVRKVRNISVFWSDVKGCFRADVWDLLPHLSQRRRPTES